jgi:hypothetical protein
VVTSGLAHEVEAEVLITLPDTEDGDGVASVTADGVTRRVKASTSQELRDLLTEQFPGEIHHTGTPAAP